MRKQFITICLLCLLPLGVRAQAENERSKNDPIYLKGAVPEVNGKVEFEKIFPYSGTDKHEVFSNLLTWANKRFTPKEDFNARVVYSNEDKGQIVALGEEYLVFSSSTLSLDRTRINYMLTLEVDDAQCKATISRIQYLYDEHRNGGEKYSAEEWITDRMTLNKKGTKLTPITGKFRRKTIDLREELFAAVAQHLPAPQVGAPTPVRPVASAAFLRLKAQGESVEISSDAQAGFTELMGKKYLTLIIENNKIAANALLGQNKEFELETNGQTIHCSIASVKPLTDEQRSLYGERFVNSKAYTVYVCLVK